MKIEKLTLEDLHDLRKIFGVCLLISKYTPAQAFFNYSPHVESYDVSLHENGWDKGRLIGRYHIYLHDGYNNLKEKNALVKALNNSLADIDIENLLLGY